MRGRMACVDDSTTVGKVFEHPVPLERLRIEFPAAAPEGGPPLSISEGSLDEDTLARVAAYLRGDTVQVRIRLGQGDHSETVWGCDLTEGYIHINAEYTT